MTKPPKFDVPFSLGDRVHIDGDSSLSAVVTAVCWRAVMPEVEISWVHNGDVKSAWMPPWRLAAHLAQGSGE